MNDKKIFITTNNLILFSWVMLGIYFIVQPIFHNAGLTGIIWKVGILSLGLISIMHMRYFPVWNYCVICIILSIILIRGIPEGLFTNPNKMFSVIAFINLTILISKSNEIQLKKGIKDKIYWITVCLIILFFLYSFTEIATKVTTDGRVWHTIYFVFNLDNSNIAGIYLYAFYCIIMIFFQEKKSLRGLNIFLMIISIYMIWRTQARSCMVAVIVATILSVYIKNKKIKNWFIIVIYLFPALFIVGYLWLYNTGFENLMIGGKSLFSGRQETFLEYFSVIEGPMQIMLGNIAQSTFSNAHNAVLSIYCSIGLTGTIAYYYLIVKKTIIANCFARSMMNRTAIVCILGFIIQTSGEASILLGGFPGAPFIFLFFIFAYSKE